MNTNPNQKRITINKPELRQLDKFAYYGRDELAQACKLLNGSEFKLWIYLLAQSPNVKWTLSPSAIAKEFGIPEPTYHRVIKNLRKKGYLDEKGIHMSIKIKESQNDTQPIKTIEKTSQSDDRNKITNSINNNNFVITSDDKVEKEFQEMKSSTIDSNLKHKQWRNDVTADGLWITPTNHTVKVIFDN